ncbi:hypothetical protein TNCV_1347751 [Trichonephila clavipes]|nr:hypothetical protein TNCV_1347751 [Trichonephila clavipes]
MPTSQENAQFFFHSQGLAVLCIKNNGFTLTNGVVSNAIDRACPNDRLKFLHYLNVGTICVSGQHSKQTFKEIQTSWSSSNHFKRTPVMLLNSNGRKLGQRPFCNQTTCHRWIAVQDGSTHILLKSIKEDSSRRFISVDASHQCTMDQIDAFSEHISTIVVPVTLPEKPDALEYAARQGTSPCLHHLRGTQHETSFCFLLQRQLVPKKTLMDNFKRAIMEAKHVNEFRPDDVLWEKISKALLKNPDRPLKNTDKRMVYIYNNMLFCEKRLYFWLPNGKVLRDSPYSNDQRPHVNLCFPSSSLRCRANPNLLRGTLSHMIRCSIIEWCRNPTRHTRS